MARRFWVAAAVLVTSITLRFDPAATYPPFDDLYHAKRIAYSAAHFPHVLAFDRDRGLDGAFCPWPPLYDLACATVSLAGAPLKWLPPIGYSLFAAAVAFALGPVAGIGTAVSPYLINVSKTAAIDHHWIEPALLLLILFATARRRPLLLGFALTAAMFVQTAFLIAGAIAFAICFRQRWGWISFAMPAVAIAIYRLAQSPGYPGSAWFLGWPHAACFAAAAIACAFGLLFGVIVVAPFLPTILHGLSFFGRDAWLRTIIEFQPMFRDVSRIGTDIANLTGGAILIFAIARRHPTLAAFGIPYLLLALTSRRFLVPAIPLLVIAGAIAAAEMETKTAAIVAIALTLAPPVAYDIWRFGHPEPADRSVIAIANAICPLPPGRVLAPWWMGHAIDVIGRHPVVMDNFGSMPDAALFERASAALRDRDFAWCRAHDIRYVVVDGKIVRLR
ncbi:MAG: hypothetical protein M3041_06755 [Acidobacteriota bacterium]|nr:hypothetical protein [Acidobacteriota bacterium]